MRTTACPDGRLAAAPRRATSVLLALALALTLLPATSTAASAADGQAVFNGRGYGHGRGMGQYGALGYAVDHGWGYQQILDHYYGGTRLAGDAGNPVIGVRITRLDGKDTILTAPGLTVDGQAAGTAAVLVRREANGTYSVLRGPSCAGPWSAWTSGKGAGVQVTTTAAPSSAEALLRLCEVGRTTGLRGSVVVQASGATQTTVNRLPVDSYLASVVPSESPASWGSAGGGRGMHALKAQAVAARSYAMSGDTSAICDTTSCQVYRGAYTWPDGAGITWIEQVSTSQAVGETSGQVRRSTATNAIARTEFSSSTGGWTAGGAFPAVQDLGDATSSNPSRSWSVPLSFTALASKLGTGTITGIAVTGRNGLGADGGRVTSVVVTTAGGAQRTFTGAQVRSALGLRSDWFTIATTSSGATQAVVRKLYRDLLGRDVDATGLATWTARLDQGTPQPELVRTLTSSLEYRRLRIRQAYVQVLGREPEAAGMQSWLERIAAGHATVDDVRLQFYASQEYFNLSGRTDEGYVRRLYRTALNRDPSAGDLAHWVAQLRASGREAVVNRIWFSNEAARIRAGEYYGVFLDRAPDSSGLATWAGVLLRQGEGAVREGIAGSLEYRNLAVATFG